MIKMISVKLLLGFLGCWSTLTAGVASVDGTSSQTMKQDHPDEMPEVRKLQTDTVVGIVKSQSSLSTLGDIITAAGLETELSGTGPFTIFAPSNTAFALIPDNYIFMILNDPSSFVLHLKDIVYHLVADGDVLSTDLNDGRVVNVKSGESVDVANTGTITLTDNDGDTALLLGANNLDEVATNGIVHSTNGALLPSFMAKNVFELGSSFFQTIIQRLGLEDMLRNEKVTVLMPNVEAFINMPGDLYSDNDALDALIKNHIIEGVYPSQVLQQSGQTVLTTLGGENLRVSISADGSSALFQGIPATKIDVLGRNGIVYMMDTVLLALTEQPTMSPTITRSPTMSPTPEELTLADWIKRDADLSTLSSLVQAAGLEDRLREISFATVFAPINAAFDSVDPALLTQLSEPDWIGHLAEVVTLHAAQKRISLSLLTNQTVMNMISSDRVIAAVNENNTVTLSGGVSGTDPTVESRLPIIASNGFMYKIDSVLLPSFVNNDLLSVLANDGQFLHTYFLNWITIVGMEDMLRSGVYTILAPTDEAVNRLPENIRDELNNPQIIGNLETLVQYHMIPQLLPIQNIQQTAYPTVQGARVLFGECFCGIGYSFNDKAVVESNLLANNGLVYGIDGVLEVVDATPFPTRTPTPAPVAVPVSPTAQLQTEQPTLLPGNNVGTLPPVVAPTRAPTPIVRNSPSTATSSAMRRGSTLTKLLITCFTVAYGISWH